MSYFIVVETNAGLQVIGVSSSETSEEAAKRNDGVIVDTGPYHTHDDAYDAMMLIPDEERERARLRD